MQRAILLLFFKQKTASELRMSDWSSDVCSSDLLHRRRAPGVGTGTCGARRLANRGIDRECAHQQILRSPSALPSVEDLRAAGHRDQTRHAGQLGRPGHRGADADRQPDARGCPRSEEHTSELQSLMRISYAVFCLKSKNTNDKSTVQPMNPSTRMHNLSLH